MLRARSFGHIAVALALSGLLAGPTALAEKPEFAGGGKGGGKSEQHQKQERYESGDTRGKNKQNTPDDRKDHAAETRREDRGRPDDRDTQPRGDRDYRDDRRESLREHRHFEDRQRSILRSYYADEFRRGTCPPGLAKKRNGCMPPGLAKQWRVGERLPRDVRYYDLPDRLVLELGPPPAMHKYVRVGADILLIALGTGLVIDALEDLGGM